MTRNTTKNIDAIDAQLPKPRQRDALKPALVEPSLVDFKRLMRETAEVIHCYHVTGDHTFVMIVALPSMEAFSGFAARVFDSNKAVAKFRTSVVMNRMSQH